MKNEALITDARFPYPVPQTVIDKLVKDANGHPFPWDDLTGIGFDEKRFPFHLRKLYACASRLYRLNYTLRYLQEGGCGDEKAQDHADAVCELEGMIDEMVDKLINLVDWSMDTWPYDPLVKEAARGHLRVIEDYPGYNSEDHEQDSVEG